MKNCGVIFDLDGTLWNPTEVIFSAWSAVFERNGAGTLQVGDLYAIMGLSSDKIKQKLLGKFDKAEQDRIFEESTKEEMIDLRKHGGKVYPKLLETLQNLKNKYKLFIVSNCGVGYIENFLQFYKLNDFISDFECFGKTNRPKGENIELVVKRNKLDKAIYIGDTATDQAASKQACVPFVHANYGFGKLVEKAEHEISCLSELPVIAHKLLD